MRADRDCLALVGRASNQSIADRAMALVAPLVKTVVDNLQVVPPGADKQIILRVKFAEVNRNVAKSFGVNLLSTGAGNTPGRITTGQFPSGTPSSLQGQIPGTLTGASTNFSLSDVLNIFAFRPDLNLGVVIRDLQAQGLLQILAEPNLVTTNGKEASFLVGGEFPVPVVQGGQNAGAITIVFREFGIRLTFLPQITAPTAAEAGPATPAPAMVPQLPGGTTPVEESRSATAPPGAGVGKATPEPQPISPAAPDAGSGTGTAPSAPSTAPATPSDGAAKDSDVKPAADGLLKPQAEAPVH